MSRYQSTIDERHRFQERVRLEAIEAARYSILYCITNLKSSVNDLSMIE